MDKWKCLILCTGHANPLLRSFVKTELERMGFVANVYDSPGYPVDPSLHSHSACVTAISQHDIVLAFADESEGGTFQVDQAPKQMIDWLRQKHILPPDGSANSIPTIFQVEVLAAKALDKPTLVFIPHTVQARVEQQIKLLRDNALQLTPKSSSVPDSRALIDESNWQELDANYEVASGVLRSFRQIAFIERIRKEAPNFVSFYQEDRLAAEIKSRIAGVAEVLIRKHSNFVSDRIEKQRDIIATRSLKDLFESGLIIASPYKMISGAAGGPLFSIRPTDTGKLARSVLDRRSVLLLGKPGLGKTTSSLLSFRDIVGAVEVTVEGYAPLFANWRDLDDVLAIIAQSDFSLTADFVIRALLALPYGREPWPSQVPLPNKQWVLELDGLDESSAERSTILRVIEALSQKSVLVVTCRSHDYERYLQTSSQYFNEIVQLEPWEDPHIQAYIRALRDAGRQQAADFIEHLIREGHFPEFLSIPLWLSLLAFLGERTAARIGRYQQLVDDYEVLRTCSDAVAEDEVARYNLDPQDTDFLRVAWGKVAWAIHATRRDKRSLTTRELQEAIEFESDSPRGRAILAFIDTLGVRIIGFFHEVFHEYWLAEYLVEQLVKQPANPSEIASLFRYQRSVVTNRLIRLHIKSRENASEIASRLREAFWNAGNGEFAKNQIVYLLGRIDDSQATRAFLSSIWHSNEETDFVKYSAAYAAIMLGDGAIESEYFRRLSTSDSYDRINRGYHLFYYQDVDISEASLPWLDDNKVSAEGALRNLFRRLGRGEDRYRNVHRIELFTIRRFLETGRTLPSDISDPESIIRSVVEGSRDRHLSDDYVSGIEEEARQILNKLRT